MTLEPKIHPAPRGETAHPENRRLGTGRGEDERTLDVVRIRPHEVTVGTLVRDLLDSFQDLHLVDRTQGWREASMDTQDSAINHRSEIQVIEDFHAILPRVGVAILAHALLEEAIDLSDLSGLVVATQEGHVGGISRFETQQELEGLPVPIFRRRT